MLRHTRYNQFLKGVFYLIRLKLEEWFNVDDLTINGQDPCNRPCIAAPFMLVLWTPLVMVDRRGDGGKSALFTRDDILYFDYEVNDI